MRTFRQQTSLLATAAVLVLGVSLVVLSMMSGCGGNQTAASTSSEVSDTTASSAAPTTSRTVATSGTTSPPTATSITSASTTVTSQTSTSTTTRPSTTSTTARPATTTTTVLSTTTTRANATLGVAIQDFSFQPSSLTIKAGDRVVWTNQDSADHTVTADDGSFGSPNLSQGETYSHTFAQAGTYGYYCALHPSMHGSVTVN